MSREAMQMALEALEDVPYMSNKDDYERLEKVTTALRQALEKPKYRRGDRLLCLETEEYCVIHISGTDRQYVKFPDGHVGQYTNQQVADHFELLPKEVDADDTRQYQRDQENVSYMYTLPENGALRISVPLPDPQITWGHSNTSEIWARVDKDGNVTHLDMELCAKGPHNAYTALAIGVWNAALEEAARYAAGEGNDLLADSVRELRK